MGHALRLVEVSHYSFFNAFLVPRPSKRFWVTAICYTILVILIKYLCSFFPSIQKPDQDLTSAKITPFFAPRIIGVEQREGSKLKYLDIGQLLVLFFQRGLLKVILWIAMFLSQLFRFMVCGKTMTSSLITTTTSPCRHFLTSRQNTVSRTFRRRKYPKLNSGKKVLGIGNDQSVTSYHKSERSHSSNKQGCFTLSAQGALKVSWLKGKS